MSAPQGWLASVAGVLLIIVLACAAAGRGMNDIPLNDHEIYVAQTAENMLQSGDWLVPRLNGTYRLTKPPLSYWIVAGAARALGRHSISPAVARLPSVLSVAGIALLTLWIGLRLFDGRVGVLAALMCVASVAAFKYGHNARPDMLYAFWTTAVLAAWIGSRDATTANEKWWIGGLWIVFGLATITKGPQAPLILLLAVALHAGICEKRRLAGLRRLRPLRGVLVVLLMTAPWYVRLRQHVGSATLDHSQLSGSLLTIDPFRIFTSFYIVHSPLLWLPWAILLPAAAVEGWRDRRGASGLLALAILVAMLCFALGPQYRQIYMLPWLSPTMLLLAAALVRVPRARFGLYAVYVVVWPALVWLARQAGWDAIVPLIAAAVLMIVAGRALWRRHKTAAAGLVAVVFAIGLFVGGSVPKLWSPARYHERAFSQAIAPVVTPDMSIVVWDINPAHFSYYLNQPAQGSASLSRVCRLIARQATTTLLIFPANRQKELAQRLPVAIRILKRQARFAAIEVPGGAICHRADTAGS